jgi:hypothetical protein
MILELEMVFGFFGNDFLNKPTIELTTVPSIPILISTELLMVLIGATIVITVAVRLRKKTVNKVSVA